MVFKLKPTWYEVSLSALLFVYFMFGLSNIAGLHDISIFYAFLALGAIIISVIADALVPDRFEKPPFKVSKNMIIFGCAAIFFFMLWYLHGTGYAIVAAPEFASIQLDNTGESINSGLAGMTEDNLFFYALPLLIAGIIYKLTKRWDIAIIGYFLTGIIGFTFFHWARYGTDVPALTTTAMFAIFGTSISYLTMVLLLVHVLHFSNNFLLRLFKTVTLSSLIFGLTSSPIFWFIIVGVPFMIYIYKRK